ncbi:MAG: Mur ligase family protein [Candidatus Paceibacterota bacterium]
MDLDLSKIKKVFFVGIGGIGISAIARMMFLEGKDVSGSDMSENELTNELSKLGIKITIGQDFELIPVDVDLIVYTIAIPHYDPKLFEQIKNSGILYKSYPQMLYYVTNNKYTIAISGTHGKTTTTAMIGKMLIDAKLDPSIIVGSILKEYKSNLIVGQSEYFVVEACEYERSFLNINPTILVITNIEPDHLDYYKDLADIENAFSKLVDQTRSFIVCDANNYSIKKVLTGKNIQIVDYTTYLDKVPKLSVPGDFNRMNAACALAVASILKISKDQADVSLSNFQGTWRRLEKKGITKEGVIIYDDYAHHPTEVRASLSGLRELYPAFAHATAGEAKRITVLFQPHLYSRTKALFDEFVTCFDEADRVYILPIYFARESPDPEISSEKLALAIKNHKGEATAFKDFLSAEDFIRSLNLGNEDVFVTMGAGEAYKVTEKVFKTV